MATSSAFDLWKQAGGGTEHFDRDEYRRLMIEHGLLIPGPPEPLPCGWPQRSLIAGATIDEIASAYRDEPGYRQEWGR